MKLNLIFISIIGIILFNHCVLPRLFNIRSMLSVPESTKLIIYMGFSLIIILVLSGLFILAINMSSHLRFGSSYLGNILLIPVSALLGYAAIITGKKLFTSVYKLFNAFFLVLMISCVELSLMIVILSGFTSESSPSDVFIHGISAGAAYIIVSFLLKGIFERLEFAEVNPQLKEIAIPVIAGCLLALAFSGFSGIII